MDYVQSHAVEQWFYEHVAHPRTLRGRLDRNEPFKDREADRFERLTLLLSRAMKPFRTKIKHWVGSPPRAGAFRRHTLVAQRAGIGLYRSTRANAAYCTRDSST